MNTYINIWGEQRANLLCVPLHCLRVLEESHFGLLDSTRLGDNQSTRTVHSDLSELDVISRSVRLSLVKLPYELFGFGSRLFSSSSSLAQ